MKKPKVINLKRGVLICGDAARILPKNVPDESVDLVLTSPPYDELRSYKGYTFDFKAIARELARTLKPGGVIVWVVGDATVKGSETLSSFNQAIYFRKLGLRLNDTMVFAKNNPIPGNQGPRYRGSFEYMFVFSKGKPKTFNPIPWKIKEQLSFNESVRFEKQGRRGYKRTLTGHIDGKEEAHQEGKVVRIKGYQEPESSAHPNIFFYTVGKKNHKHGKHSAVFPDELAEDQIRTWTNPGDVVLDPFLGSGTSCKMSEILGRDYVGIEISEEYLNGAESSIREAEGFTELFDPEDEPLSEIPIDFE